MFVYYSIFLLLSFSKQKSNVCAKSRIHHVTHFLHWHCIKIPLMRSSNIFLLLEFVWLFLLDWFGLSALNWNKICVMSADSAGTNTSGHAVVCALKRKQKLHSVFFILLFFVALIHIHFYARFTFRRHAIMCVRVCVCVLQDKRTTDTDAMRISLHTLYKNSKQNKNKWFLFISLMLCV